MFIELSPENAVLALTYSDTLLDKKEEKWFEF